MARTANRVHIRVFHQYPNFNWVSFTPIHSGIIYRESLSHGIWFCVIPLLLSINFTMIGTQFQRTNHIIYKVCLRVWSLHWIFATPFGIKILLYAELFGPLFCRTSCFNCSWMFTLWLSVFFLNQLSKDPKNRTQQVCHITFNSVEKLRLN